MTEYGPFTRALVDLASRGGRPPCGSWAEHNLWLSENHEERAQAAALCQGCLVIAECGEAADQNGERFGVWGGRDWTKRARPAEPRKGGGPSGLCHPPTDSPPSGARRVIRVSPHAAQAQADTPPRENCQCGLCKRDRLVAS